MPILLPEETNDLPIELQTYIRDNIFKTNDLDYILFSYELPPNIQHPQLEAYLPLATKYATDYVFSTLHLKGTEKLESFVELGDEIFYSKLITQLTKYGFDVHQAANSQQWVAQFLESTIGGKLNIMGVILLAFLNYKDFIIKILDRSFRLLSQSLTNAEYQDLLQLIIWTQTTYQLMDGEYYTEVIAIIESHQTPSI